MQARRVIVLALSAWLLTAGSALQAETTLRSGVWDIMKNPTLPKTAATIALSPPNPFLLIPAESCASMELAAPPDTTAYTHYQEARHCRLDLPQGARVVRVTAFGIDPAETLDIAGSSWLPSAIAESTSYVDFSLENRFAAPDGLQTHVAYCLRDYGAGSVHFGERVVSMTCTAPDGSDPGRKDANSEVVLRMDTLAMGSILNASSFHRYIRFILPFVKLIKVEYQPGT